MTGGENFIPLVAEGPFNTQRDRDRVDLFCSLIEEQAADLTDLYYAPRVALSEGGPTLTYSDSPRSRSADL